MVFILRAHTSVLYIAWTIRMHAKSDTHMHERGNILHKIETKKNSCNQNCFCINMKWARALVIECNTPISATFQLHLFTATIGMFAYNSLVEWMKKNTTIGSCILNDYGGMQSIGWRQSGIHQSIREGKKRRQNCWSIDTSFKRLEFNSTSTTWWRDWNFRLKFRFNIKCQCDIQTCAAKNSTNQIVVNRKVFRHEMSAPQRVIMCELIHSYS